MKNFFLLKIFVVFLFLISSAMSKQSNFFDKGLALFQKKEFDKSKVLFEKDIVFNPKNEKSYLYLAKIFNQKKNDQEEEMNLKNVLLLNPKNDEAIYMLTLLRIKQSNYHEAKELIKKFNLVCNSFCSKSDEMQEKFEKLIPKDAKNKN